MSKVDIRIHFSRDPLMVGKLFAIIRRDPGLVRHFIYRPISEVPVRLQRWGGSLVDAYAYLMVPGQYPPFSLD